MGTNANAIASNYIEYYEMAKKLEKVYKNKEVVPGNDGMLWFDLSNLTWKNF